MLGGPVCVLREPCTERNVLKSPHLECRSRAEMPFQTKFQVLLLHVSVGLAEFAIPSRVLQHGFSWQGDVEHK